MGSGVGGTGPGDGAAPPSRARCYTLPVPIYRLPRAPVFPEPHLAEPDGLLAVGGDLSPERLLQAYAAGIFPWFSEGGPILWWSPDPRLVLEPDRLHVPRSLARTMRRGRYRVRADTCFARVIRRCAEKPRPGQEGTWITEGMASAYERLHQLGFAHSFEAWDGPLLAGGLYGVSLGGAFFGESMFSDTPDASKVALVRAVTWLVAAGIELIDCQVRTEHLLRFGAHEIRRQEFLGRLARALEKPTLRGRWQLDEPAGGPAR